MLLVPVHRTPRVYGGASWPECCEPVQWGRQVVLDCVECVGEGVQAVCGTTALV